MALRFPLDAKALPPFKTNAHCHERLQDYEFKVGMPVASCETPKGGAYCNGECGKIIAYDKKVKKVSVLIEGQQEATVLDLHQFNPMVCSNGI